MEHDLGDELISAREWLAANHQQTTALQGKLAAVYHDRDLLLTRIEVLEQAVNMMHDELAIQQLEEVAQSAARMHLSAWLCDFPFAWGKLYKSNEHRRSVLRMSDLSWMNPLVILFPFRCRRM